VVVSAGDKSDEVNLMQVEVRETTARKPSMTRRKPATVVKTRGVSISWDKPVRHLSTGQAATGV
jgi:hypothetical protein